MIVDDGLTKGLDAKTIADQVVRQSGMNRSFRGLNGQDQNATLYALAQEYALQGRPDVVKAILDNDRGGVGAVSKSAEYAVKSAQLVEAAGNLQNKTASEQAFDLRVDIDRQIAEGSFTDKKAKEYMEANPWLKERASEVSSWVQQSTNNRRVAEEKQAKFDAKQVLAQEATRSEQQAVANAVQQMTTVAGGARLKDVEVATPSGGTRTMSKADLQAKALDVYRQRWASEEQQLQAEGRSPEEAHEVVMREKVRFFSDNGISNPEWENVFNASAIVGAATRMAEKGEVSQSLGKVAEDYFRLKQLNPALAAAHVKDSRAEEFLDTYADARSDLTIGKGMSHEDALLEAARVANRTPEERRMSVMGRKEAEDVVDDAMKEGWFFGPSIDGDYRQNPQNLRMAIDLAQKYARMGMGKDKAVKRASEEMKERAVYVNGVALLQTGRVFPKDFGELAEGYLQHFAQTKTGDPEATGEDLYLVGMNDGTDRLVIMNKAGIADMDVVTFKDLEGFRAHKEDQQAVKEAEWGRQVKSEGYARAVLNWGLNGFEVRSSNMTPDQAKKFLADKKEQDAVDAYVKRQAEADNIYYDSLNGRWQQKTSTWNPFATPRTVKPVVTWSASEKSVRWEPVKD
ncbi:hypothetical protein [Jiella pacifica]|uniref:Uncharacterized protein n=1 Tax=Jiella pacifica TaxID=2696469 RepID=A0A6N9T1N1_9HYPH|nr:hypothetical protein [Jiella pacifica]NDW03956.1 hypothetical protein [Jiella pacifica]